MATDDTGRGADGHGVVGQGAGHHRAGADHEVLADVGAAEDERAVTNGQLDACVPRRAAGAGTRSRRRGRWT
jgi:hypothetical protein